MEGIVLKGCRENNLKNISLTIPYSKVVAFVGVSGSGKTSIVFDTLYAEGKRKYLESLGVNESFFLSKTKKPDADYISGLPPTIALAQSKTIVNSRSTVGTISQLAYFVQLLFASCSDSKERAQLTLSMFNLNSPRGMCATCGGEGEILNFDETLIWPDQSLSYKEGGIRLGSAKPGTVKFEFMNSFLKQYGYTVDSPICEYSNELKVALLFGQAKTKKYKLAFPGIIPEYEKIYRTTKSYDMHSEIEKYMSALPCQDCFGTGYNPESLKTTFCGYNIAQIMNFSIEKLYSFLSSTSFSGSRQQIFESICAKMLTILKKCISLGIGYLSLARRANTLSGGEMQRLRLVAQISSEISGVVYVLDEPSTGMHPHDIEKLIAAIAELKNIGNKNTIIVVDHNKKIINFADYVFEIGPGAGENGGQIIAEGAPRQLINNPQSITAKYLSNKASAGIINRSEGFEVKEHLEIVGAHAHNLKDVDVKIPLGAFVCVTGVSGSGKTSLAFDCLYQSLKSGKDINVKQIRNRDKINKIILCDQSTIGANSRSCPATYLEIYDEIRRLFASTKEAKQNHFDDRFFSFNLKEGQCPTCHGEGLVKVNMGFMADINAVCEDCNGKRFNEQVLSIRYKNKDIASVLDLSIDEALEFFKDNKTIVSKLLPVKSVGLGYIKLGQPTSSLSGGETQRLKLSYELAKVKSKNNLIIFDEPSRGLHFEDVRKLVGVLKSLTAAGHTVIAVEHNLDIMASADYIIDIGPGSGENGGAIIGCGSPKQISRLGSFTGQSLREYFAELDKI